VKLVKVRFLFTQYLLSIGGIGILFMDRGFSKYSKPDAAAMKLGRFALRASAACFRISSGQGRSDESA
jgi:hypothetical protein